MRVGAIGDETTFGDLRPGMRFQFLSGEFKGEWEKTNEAEVEVTFAGRRGIMSCNAIRADRTGEERGSFSDKNEVRRIRRKVPRRRRRTA